MATARRRARRTTWAIGHSLARSRPQYKRRACAAAALSARVTTMTTAYDFTATDIGGGERSLREFAGRALLIVNVASKCGFTPQYQGLEALWRKRRDAGLTIL